MQVNRLILNKMSAMCIQYATLFNASQYMRCSKYSQHHRTNPGSTLIILHESEQQTGIMLFLFAYVRWPERVHTTLTLSTEAINGGGSARFMVAEFVAPTDHLD